MEKHKKEVKMNKSIYKQLLELKEKFNDIRKKEYVKAMNNGYCGIGDTFEMLLGKEKSDFCFPDYKDIEIKTRKAYSKSLISLFCCVPDGDDLFEVERIRKTYGYPDKIIKDAKTVFVTVYANKYCKMGNNYHFKLDVDNKERRVYLCIYDKEFNLIERKTYWSFEILEERLYTKLKYLMLVYAWDKKINNEIYYKYYKCQFYKLKDFDNFIESIKNRAISITFRIGVRKGQYKYGLPYNHGLSFGVGVDNLPCIYEEIILE